MTFREVIKRIRAVVNRGVNGRDAFALKNKLVKSVSLGHTRGVGRGSARTNKTKPFP